MGPGCRSRAVQPIGAEALVALLEAGLERVVLIDSRPFVDYNASHILEAVNVNCSKLMKRRLQQDKVQIHELLQHSARKKVDTAPPCWTPQLLVTTGKTVVTCQPTGGCLCVFVAAAGRSGRGGLRSELLRPSCCQRRVLPRRPAAQTEEELPLHLPALR